MGAPQRLPGNPVPDHQLVADEALVLFPVTARSTLFDMDEDHRARGFETAGRNDHQPGSVLASGTDESQSDEQRNESEMGGAGHSTHLVGLRRARARLASALGTAYSPSSSGPTTPPRPESTPGGGGRTSENPHGDATNPLSNGWRPGPSNGRRLAEDREAGRSR